MITTVQRKNTNYSTFCRKNLREMRLVNRAWGFENYVLHLEYRRIIQLSNDENPIEIDQMVPNL